VDDGSEAVGLAADEVDEAEPRFFFGDSGPTSSIDRYTVTGGGHFLGEAKEVVEVDELDELDELDS